MPRKCLSSHPNIQLLCGCYHTLGFDINQLTLHDTRVYHQQYCAFLAITPAIIILVEVTFILRLSLHNQPSSSYHTQIPSGFRTYIISLSASCRKEQALACNSNVNYPRTHRVVEHPSATNRRQAITYNGITIYAQWRIVPSRYTNHSPSCGYNNR